MKRLLFLCALLIIGLCANTNAENLDSLNQFTGWDYSGNIRTQKLKTDAYIYCQLMENGKELFTADYSGFMRIWNLETGKLRYSKQLECQRVFANYKNDIVYYHLWDSLYGYNMKTDSLLFKYNDQSFKFWDPGYSFHSSNKILIPIVKSIYVNDYYVWPYYYQCSYETQVFDCDKAAITYKPEFPFANGYKFIYSKRNPNLFIYSDRHWRSDFGVNPVGTDYDENYSIGKNSTNSFSHMELAKQYNNSFSANERYMISVYDTSLKFCDLTKTVDQKFESRLLNYSVNKFVIDKEDRIITMNDEGTELIIGCWAASISAEKIPINNTLSLTYLALNSDSTAVIAAGVSGTFVYIPLNVSSQIKAGLTANRTNINVGEQVDFTSTSTGLVTDFKILISDGGEITDYGMKYIFKKSGDFDVTIIAGDGVNYDTLVYKNMIHVAPKVKPLLASYTEDRRFGYLPLTVNFKNTTNKPYSSIEWDFGDGTTSNEENPQHSFYQYGKYVVTLTLVSNGETLSLSKDFNVIQEKFQGERSGAGSYYSEHVTKWTTESSYDNLVVSNDDCFYYTGHESTCMDGSSQYSYTAKSELVFCNGWNETFKIDNPNFSYRRYLNGGIVTSTGLVYNNLGQVLFLTEKTTPGTIIPDRNRDSLISYDDNKIYYCDQYFEPIWNIDFFDLTNDSCNVLNVTPLYNGNIALFLHLKQADKVERYELEPITGTVVESSDIPCAANKPIYHLNDSVYLSYIDAYFVKFDKNGKVLKKEFGGHPSMYKLDSNLFMTSYSDPDMLEKKFYDGDLKLLFKTRDSSDNVLEYHTISPIMLTDKSIVFMMNIHYYFFHSYRMTRYFFPEIYDKPTSIDSTKKSVIRPVSFPLPAVDEVSIGLDSIGTAESIEVMDLNGNLCNAAIKSSDSNTLILDISKLGPGTYFYSINSNGKQYKGKFIKQK